MKSEIDIDLNNPLPYIFLVFILSSFFYKTYSSDKLLAIAIVSGFFLLLLFYKGIFITSIISLFFAVGLFNNHQFYNYIPDNIEEIRIDTIKSYYVRGKIGGRNVYLDIEIDELVVGDKILAIGKFNKNLDLSKGIIGEYKVESYNVLKKDFISYLYYRRERLYEAIKSKLGRRKAGFITSVAFGYSEAIDNEDRDDMKVFGISHAIAVSGLHMAIVYGILKKLFGSKLSLVIALAYVLFTGASPSTVRAYIMILIMNFALVVKRNYNPIAAISLAGIILLIVRPYDLFSLGFVLSFLATLGIILFNKKLNKKLYKLPKKIREVVSVSISAQILTFPILIYSFNEFSLNFLIGNIFIIPIINILVLIGNLLLIFYKITPVFNYLLYLCYWCIKFIDNIMDFFWDYKIDILYLNFTIAFFYSILIITYYFYRKGYKKFILLPIISLIYIFILNYNPIPNIRYYKEGALLVSFRGENILIQTKALVDKVKLKKITMSDNIYKDFNEINIKDKIIIKKEGKNYKLETVKKEYMLVVNKEKIDTEYDIIDFSTGDLQEVIIFDDKVISR